jgi:hypothetical protein
MLIHRLTSRRQVRVPRPDVSTDGPSGLLLTRYAGCVGRVLGKALIASGQCGGHLPPYRLARRDEHGEWS